MIAYTNPAREPFVGGVRGNDPGTKVKRYKEDMKLAVPCLSLEGKIAIVSGSRRGIGRAIALLYAEAGADVAVCDYVAADELNDTAEEIRKLGRRSLAVQVNVSDKASVTNLVEKVEAELGPVDILANAAGVLRVNPSIDFSEEDWDIVIDTNLKGTFLMNQAVARGMIKRKKGSIINIAATDAFNPLPNQAAYNCSKIGVRHLTNTLAFEWGLHNVRVNAIAPGCVHTDMMASYGIDDAVTAAEIALGRMGEPIDIANTALFLASDRASWVSGVTWRVDGGTNMGPLAMWPEDQV